MRVWYPINLQSLQGSDPAVPGEPGDAAATPVSKPHMAISCRYLRTNMHVARLFAQIRVLDFKPVFASYVQAPGPLTSAEGAAEAQHGTARCLHECERT